MSDIMANNPKGNKTSTVSVAPSHSEEVEVEKKCGEVKPVDDKVDQKELSCSEINEGNVGRIVNEIIKATKSDGKKTIKIQIEITTE